MATSKSVTRYRSTVPPVESRPLPQLRAKLDDRQYRRLLANDALVAVAVLNASRRSARHAHLAGIRQGLEELRLLASETQQIAKKLDALPVGSGETEECKALSQQYDTIMRRLHDRHVAMNEALAGYAFRPTVSYMVVDDAWRYGLVPDRNRQFHTKIGPYTVGEADAALALVRLDANGELLQVKLCEHCHRVWFYARRPTFDRHCSKDCREGAYKEDPEYLARKAKNQKDYRLNQKREEARERRVAKL